MTEMPSEDEIRERIRIGLSGLGVAPPVVVDSIMRNYFWKWATTGRKEMADRWLDRELRSMALP